MVTNVGSQILATKFGFVPDWSTLVQVMAWCCHSGRQQAITWANVDPDFCHHMVSLGHNDWVNIGSSDGWCHQATSHYLNQCWRRSMMPYMASLGHNELIHFNLNKMAIYLMTFLGAFSWKKNLMFLQISSCSLFSWAKLAMNPHLFRYLA